MPGDERFRNGRGHELLASVCFDKCWSRIFPWVTKIRLGTEEEDSCGKDVIVETADVGDIPVQIKSSGKFLKKHYKKYPDIPVLVVYPTHNEEEVRKRLANLIKRERRKRDPSYQMHLEGIHPLAPAPEREALTVSMADLMKRRA